MPPRKPAIMRSIPSISITSKNRCVRRASSIFINQATVRRVLLNNAGLFAPEFQIINAGSAITAPNYFYNAIRNNDLHRWGSGVPAQTVRLSIDQELGMIVPAATDQSRRSRRSSW